MPRLNIGERAQLSPAGRRQFSAAWQRWFGDTTATATVVGIYPSDDGTIGYDVRGDNNYHHSFHETWLELAVPPGPPTTVQEMSYKVMREAGYA